MDQRLAVKGHPKWLKRDKPHHTWPQGTHPATRWMPGNETDQRDEAGGRNRYMDSAGMQSLNILIFVCACYPKNRGKSLKSHNPWCSSAPYSGPLRRGRLRYFIALIDPDNPRHTARSFCLVPMTCGPVQDRKPRPQPYIASQLWSRITKSALWLRWL